MNLQALWIVFVLKIHLLTANTGCTDENWSLFKEHCYYLNQRELTWVESQEFCENCGGNLASILSHDEIQFLGYEERRRVWIGYHKINVDKWEWTDGAKSDFSKWNQFEPKRYAYEDCAATYQNFGNWHAYHCTLKLFGLCKIAVATINLGLPLDKCWTTPSQTFTAPRHTISGCPDENWSTFKGTCYYLNQQKLTWEEAQAFCKGCGGNLASIHSKEEENFLQFSSPVYAWIGYHKNVQTNKWEWVDGTDSKFTDWALGQPDGLDEKCTLVKGAWDAWQDHSCRGTCSSFLCKTVVSKNSTKCLTLPSVTFGLMTNTKTDIKAKTLSVILCLIISLKLKDGVWPEESLY